MSDRSPNPTLNQIRDLIRDLPGPDLEAAGIAAEREAILTKPAGSLGRLEEISLWLASWGGGRPPAVKNPRVVVFAGNHGVAARGVSAFPAAVTVEMVRNFERGGASVNQLSAVAGAELRVHALSLDTPTRDFTQGPAMSEAECADAIARGMAAVDAGVDLLALGEMGIANSCAAAAMAAAMWGGPVADWVGRGTGVDDAGLKRKIDAIEAGLAANPGAREDPLEALRCLGGFELAAITGAVLAARRDRVPVVLDGFACTVSGAVPVNLNPTAIDHCLVSHRSVEPGHTRLLARLGKAPLFEFNMRLGEASGAALAINIVRAAAACHAGMATFAQAGVSEKSA